MSIYHNLEAITQLALHEAKEHNCNYNVILYNPDENGEFSLAHGSTYEMVADSYFEKPRPNVKLITTTGEIMLKEAQNIINDASIFMDQDQLNVDDLLSYVEHESNMVYNMPRKHRYSYIDSSSSGVPYVRTERKIGNNETCPCGSNLKYKKCCKK